MLHHPRGKHRGGIVIGAHPVFLDRLMVDRQEQAFGGWGNPEPPTLPALSDYVTLVCLPISSEQHGAHRSGSRDAGATRASVISIFSANVSLGATGAWLQPRAKPCLTRIATRKYSNLQREQLFFSYIIILLIPFPPSCVCSVLLCWNCGDAGRSLSSGYKAVPLFCCPRVSFSHFGAICPVERRLYSIHS